MKILWSEILMVKKILKKKRNLLLLIPYIEYFSAVLTFGDKAVTVIKKSDFPKGIINTLKNAKK